MPACGAVGSHRWSLSRGPGKVNGAVTPGEGSQEDAAVTELDWRE